MAAVVYEVWNNKLYTNTLLEICQQTLKIWEAAPWNSQVGPPCSSHLSPCRNTQCSVLHTRWLGKGFLLSLAANKLIPHVLKSLTGGKKASVVSVDTNTRGFTSTFKVWCLPLHFKAQLRWKPFSIVAASRRSLMISSEEYSGNFR